MERLVDDMAHSVATNVDALLRETAVPPEKSKSTTTSISHGYSDMTYLSPTKLSQGVALPHTDDGHVDGQEEQRLQVNPNADITSTHIPPNSTANAGAEQPCRALAAVPREFQVSNRNGMKHGAGEDCDSLSPDKLTPRDLNRLIFDSRGTGDRSPAVSHSSASTSCLDRHSSKPTAELQHVQADGHAKPAVRGKVSLWVPSTCGGVEGAECRHKVPEPPLRDALLTQAMTDNRAKYYSVLGPRQGRTEPSSSSTTMAIGVRAYAVARSSTTCGMPQQRGQSGVTSAKHEAEVYDQAVTQAPPHVSPRCGLETGTDDDVDAVEVDDGISPGVEVERDLMLHRRLPNRGSMKLTERGATQVGSVRVKGGEGATEAQVIRESSPSEPAVHAAPWPECPQAPMDQPETASAGVGCKGGGNRGMTRSDNGASVTETEPQLSHREVQLQQSLSLVQESLLRERARVYAQHGIASVAQGGEAAGCHQGVHVCVHVYMRDAYTTHIHRNTRTHVVHVMHACMHACIHPSIHPSIHTRIHPYIHTYLQVVQRQGVFKVRVD